MFPFSSSTYLKAQKFVVSRRRKNNVSIAMQRVTSQAEKLLLIGTDSASQLSHISVRQMSTSTYFLKRNVTFPPLPTSQSYSFLPFWPFISNLKNFLKFIDTNHYLHKMRNVFNFEYEVTCVLKRRKKQIGSEIRVCNATIQNETKGINS